MLQNEICPRMKDIFREDLVRNVRKPVNGIGRIRKDDVELLPSYLKEVKNIMPHYRQIVHSELHCLRLDEICMERQHFHTIYHGGTTGRKFVRNGTSTAKEVKNLQSFHLILVVKNIEKALLGEIRCRTSLISLWRKNILSSEFATYDSHDYAYT